MKSHLPERKFVTLLLTKFYLLFSVVFSGYEVIKAALVDTEDFFDRYDIEWVLDRGFGKQIGTSSAKKKLTRTQQNSINLMLQDCCSPARIFGHQQGALLYAT